MVKKKEEEEMVVCPLGKFLLEFQRPSRRKSKFLEHLDLSRVEFYKAIRTLIDERIESLEEKKSSRQEKKATKIQVE